MDELYGPNVHAAGRVEPVDGRDQAQRADLQQVVEGLAAVAEPPGEVPDEGQVLLNHTSDKGAIRRAIGEARLITPLRSAGGHRRYSRYQLRLAARVRALVDHGTALDAACRIVILEDQLDEARRINTELNQRQPSS